MLTFGPLEPSALTIHADRVVQGHVVELALRPVCVRSELGEHGHAVELDRVHVVELDLQVLELPVVVGLVRRVLHHAVGQSLELDHPVDDLARGMQNPVLYLQEGDRVLDVDLGPGEPGHRALELHRDRQSPGVVDRLDDPTAAGQTHHALAQGIRVVGQVPTRIRGGRIGVYCYWHGIIPP